MDEIYLTRGGYEKLTEKLNHLKNVKRKKLSKAIGEARDHGDISENAEYDAAKDAQAMNEKHISELEYKLSHARIIENEDIGSDEVLIGAKVKLKDLNSDQEFKYILVAEAEADYEQNKISIASPIGAGLLNHKVGDVVEITVPAGILKYKILDISR